MKRLTVLLVVFALCFAFNTPVYSDLNDGLVLHLPFDGNTNDVSGNGHDGVEYGGLLYDWSMIGKAAKLDGLDDYIQIPYDAEIEPPFFTVSLWIKTADKHSHTRILSNNFADTGAHGYNLDLSNYGAVNFHIDPSAGGSTPVVYKYSNTVVNDGNWHHITIIYDEQGSLDIFVNGRKQPGTVTCSYPRPQRPIVIGKRMVHDPIHFNGFIDELRLYNRVLSQQEITELYNENPSTTNPDPSVGDFDTDTDVDAFDLANFALLFGTNVYSDELITLTNVPVLDQGDYSYLNGPGGCVPVSFAMLFINAFNAYNQYSIMIGESATEQIVLDLATYLEAEVTGNSTWVRPDTVYTKMAQYTFNFDVDDTDGQTEQVTWEIDFPLMDESNNQDRIDFVKAKLTDGEPVLITGYFITSNSEFGHASLITGYKKIKGAEYVKVHDTLDKTPKWWRLMTNKTLIYDGSNMDGLLRLHRDNGDDQFYLIGRMVNPTNMTVIYNPEF